MTKYAYILQGKVMYIEDRDVDISHLVAPDLTDRFVPIPEETTVRPGMIYSDGEFIDDPVTPPDIITKYQNLLLERDVLYRSVLTSLMSTASANITDAQALKISGSFYPVWPDGVDDNGQYHKGQIISYGDAIYRIDQDSVTPDESQTPDAEGMLAVYRPIVEGHKGNKKDPIPWVYGMNVKKNKYYSYGGVVYRAAENMLPCVWYPDSGIWQWEVVDG